MWKQFYLLYYDGFKNLSNWARIMWCILIVKLIIMFGVFKFWLMPNYLSDKYDTKQEKVEHIYNVLINNTNYDD
ncbi:MAG: DUF4492 domain-containing protein [Marinifilaceae bacterium]